jgi:acylphosphatase
MARIHVTIRGRVQGVGFRQATKAEADRLGIRGWVRNAADRGQVDLEATGSPEALDRFVAWLQKGPRLARVDHVAVHPAADLSPGEEGEAFEIR